MKKVFALAALLVSLLGHSASPPKLVWSYPDAPNIYFEVWRADQADGPFALWATTSQTNTPISTDGSCGFFKVRAHDRITDQVSGWATTE